ncbi:MAG: DUF2188 domain-containing protein [Steroidobacteraceae bacterium]|jgi:hypothetical protein|nr:DUF2188 domain-containing protein [Steroidobacteraceae bacterium]
MAALPHPLPTSWKQLHVRADGHAWHVLDGAEAAAVFTRRDDAVDYARGLAVLSGGGAIRIGGDDDFPDCHEVYLALPGESEPHRLTLDESE